VTGPTTAEGRRAGFVSRAAALFIDAVIITVSLRTTVWLLDALARTARGMAPPVDLATVVVAASPLLIAAYNIAFWCALGQTPGKWLMGIKIVAAGGRTPTFTQAVIRLLGYLLSALPFYLGFLWVLGPRRTAWHDRLARTEVIYVRQQRELAASHRAMA
jgi:uncharacterized RDD family membrane protein YckC